MGRESRRRPVEDDASKGELFVYVAATRRQGDWQGAAPGFGLAGDRFALGCGLLD